MKVKELYSYLNEKIPSSLSCEWDNDGLMCCPDAEKEVKRVLVALDVTAEVVNEAISKGYDAIISHHPFIFSGIKALNESDHVAKKALDAIKAGVAVMSFHTRLDAAEGGVNDKLAELLELKNVAPFGTPDEMIGRIGELESAVSSEELAEKIKEKLDCPTVLLAEGKKEIKKVAVVGGEGGDFTYAAMGAGADAYISGRLKYHQMADAAELGITLIEAGHFYTEAPVCEVLCKMLKEVSIDADKYFSNRIKAI